MLWELIVYLVLPVVILGSLLFWAFDFWDTPQASLLEKVCVGRCFCTQKQAETMNR